MQAAHTSPGLGGRKRQITLILDTAGPCNDSSPPPRVLPPPTDALRLASRGVVVEAGVLGDSKLAPSEGRGEDIRCGELITMSFDLTNPLAFRYFAISPQY